jgi:V-type H+-transporting ATPase subunit G
MATAQLKSAEVEAATIISTAREERKAKIRTAQGEAKKEVEEYKAQRESKLRTVQPEAEALAAKVQRLAADTDRKIASLTAEYERNKEPVLQMLMQVVMNIENPYGAKA